MRWFLILSLAAVAGKLVSGKIFEKCELANVLENTHKMPRDEVKSWVCIAEHESTFNTEAVNRFKNWDGSKDYGLFQLNNKYWCKDEDENPAFQNVCRMPCSKLLDGDLADDLVCIKKIIRGTEAWKGKGTGLTAWVAYNTKCANRNLDEYMSECWAGDNTISIRDEEEKQDVEEEQSANAIINVRLDETLEGLGSITGVVHPGMVDNARVPMRPMTPYIHYFQPQQHILIPQQHYQQMQIPMVLTNPYQVVYNLHG